MQSTDQINIFILCSIAVIFLLVILITSLLYFHKKKQLSYLQRINFIRTDYEQSLLKTEIEIQNQTLQTISGEIHDNITLSLILAKINLTNINWEEEAHARTVILNSTQIISSAISDLSNLSKVSNSDLITNIGFLRTTELEVARLNKLTKIKFELEVKGEPIFMHSERELVLFRMVQEGFNNVLKHSGATCVWLILNYTSTYLKISLSDNGKGCSNEEIENSNGSGLMNINKRLQLFNGSMTFESRPPNTELCINMPYENRK